MSPIASPLDGASVADPGPTDDLRFIGIQNRPTVEPGAFRIWVAPSAEADGVNDSFVLA